MRITDPSDENCSHQVEISRRSLVPCVTHLEELVDVYGVVVVHVHNAEDDVDVFEILSVFRLLVDQLAPLIMNQNKQTNMKTRDGVKKTSARALDKKKKKEQNAS